MGKVNLFSIHPQLPIRELSAHQLCELLEQYVAFVKDEFLKDRNPLFKTVTIGNQPVVVDYAGRKHLFAFNTTASSMTLTSTDGYGIVLASQVWSNLGFPEGTRLTGGTTGSVLIVKATDETVP